MLINGAAPFINGHPIYKWVPHLSADKWCSTVNKWCKFINGAQHIRDMVGLGKYFRIMDLNLRMIYSLKSSSRIRS